MPGDFDFSETTKALIQAEVIKQFQQVPDYIDTLIRSVTEGVVDENGRKPDYHSKEKMPWLTWACQENLRQTILEVVRSVIRDLRPDVELKIRELVTAERIAESCVTSFLKSTEPDWRISVIIEKDKEN